MSKTISTAEYATAYGSEPEGLGAWVFLNVESGQIVSSPRGTFARAVEALPPGDWELFA